MVILGQNNEIAAEGGEKKLGKFGSKIECFLFLVSARARACMQPSDVTRT